MNSERQHDRDELLQMTDAELLRHCRVDVQRGTGRGGQKRNTTDSAVRLTLLPHPELSVVCDDTRSQQRNRVLALRRLRLHMALQLRDPADAKSFISDDDHHEALPPRPGRDNPDYPLWAAHLLDRIAESEYQIGTAARRMGLSTGRLVRLLHNDPELWRQVNQERVKRSLKPLRAG